MYLNHIFIFVIIQIGDFPIGYRYYPLLPPFHASIPHIMIKIIHNRIKFTGGFFNKIHWTQKWHIYKL
jgi:hypothetical protein